MRRACARGSSTHSAAASAPNRASSSGENRSRRAAVHGGMRTFALAFALAAAALLPAATAADNPQLVGTTGPGFDISLVDGSGSDVHHLDPGTYDLLVHDRADIHNFHLTGPGVNVSTEIDFTGDWKAQVTLKDGTYTFLCDPHNTT